MPEAFSDYLGSNRSICAIFVGTRRTDPHGGRLSALQPTDGGWPAFMRVHPVIEWRYADIWAVSFVCFRYCSISLPTNIPNVAMSELDLIDIQLTKCLPLGGTRTIVSPPSQHPVLRALRPRIHKSRWDNRHTPKSSAAGGDTCRSRHRQRER